MIRTDSVRYLVIVPQRIFLCDILRHIRFKIIHRLILRSRREGSGLREMWLIAKVSG